MRGGGGESMLLFFIISACESGNKKPMKALKARTYTQKDMFLDPAIPHVRYWSIIAE